MRHSLRIGLLSGFASTFLLSVLYIIDKRSMVGPIHQLYFVVLLVGMVWAAMRERAELGGYIDQRTALRSAFVAFLAGSAIVSAYDFLMPAFFDPGLVLLAKEEELRQLELAKTEYATDKYLILRREIENRQGGPAFFGSVFLYFFFSIPGFLVAGLISFLVQKNKVVRLDSVEREET